MAGIPLPLCRVAGEGVFDTIPIEADYTVGDMKLWLKIHKNKDPNEYDLVGPKGVWKMGAGSEVLKDDIIIRARLTSVPRDDHRRVVRELRAKRIEPLAWPEETHKLLSETVTGCVKLPQRSQACGP